MISGQTAPNTLRVDPGGPELICPNCEVALATVTATELHAGGTFGFGKRYAYACPGCRRVLGISHRKGFWMG